jgi:energy-coupling factor transporter ATP-binding protein EcfA2
MKRPSVVRFMDECPLVGDDESVASAQGEDAIDRLEKHSLFARTILRNDPPITITSLSNLQFEYAHACQELETALFHCFESKEQASSSCFAFVTGPSGTGKSTLAKFVAKQLAAVQHGYFGRGTSWEAALTECVYNLTENNHPTAQAEIAGAVCEHLSAADRNVLVARMPELESLLGPALPLQRKTATRAAACTFEPALGQFLHAVCGFVKRPLVLVIDTNDNYDYFSNNNNNNLWKVLANTPGLFVVGVASTMTTDLARVLSQLKQSSGCVVSVVHLEPLRLDQITEYLAPLKLNSHQELADFVHEQTQGNLHHTNLLLEWLEEAELLKHNGGGKWTYSATDEKLFSAPTKVRDFIDIQLAKLPTETLSTLQVAACMGSLLDMNLITHAVTFYIEEPLQDAASRGLLVLENAGRSYAFIHDAVQEAVYDSINASEREQFHLTIGRNLRRNAGAERFCRSIFTILAQLKNGRSLITCEKEKVDVARMCLQACAKSASASALTAACEYIDFGISMLPTLCWETDYELSLSLYSAGVEMNMNNRNCHVMEELVAVIFYRARKRQDKIYAFCSKVYALGANNRPKCAIKFGLEALTELGEKIPARPSKAKMTLEYAMVRKLLRSQTNNQLLHLPNIEDPIKLACMKILQLMLIDALICDSDLVTMILLRLTRITLRHGMSSYAALAFAYYGSMVALEDLESAFRFGNLAFTVIERFKARELIPLVYYAFYGTIFHWRHPLKDTLEPLLKAHAIGIQLGDVMGASLCGNLYVIYGIEAGIPIHVLESKQRELSLLQAEHNLKGAMQLSAIVANQLHNFMGLVKHPLRRKGRLIDLDAIEASAKEAGNELILTALDSTLMLNALMFNDFKTAAVLAKAGVDKGTKVTPTYTSAIISRYVAAMTALTAARGGENVRRNVKHAKDVIHKLRKFSSACPQNILPTLFLLEAELASVQDRRDKAFEKYTCAMAMSREAGRPLMEAQAAEFAGKHLWRLDDGRAKLYMERSCEAYKEAGVLAKVAEIRREISKWYDLSEWSNNRDNSYSHITWNSSSGMERVRHLECLDST